MTYIYNQCTTYYQSPSSTLYPLALIQRRRLCRAAAAVTHTRASHSSTFSNFIYFVIGYVG